ncbi:hypothetical protein [Pedobacter sp. ASV28]|uniref:hypothetical protein n=1 Tax=Pedobacter sp. ASV28 TaxID=2795123 RepID=UPI0018EE448D|nr:hypothetical protein [Pedobacter sp. ASV28]
MKRTILLATMFACFAFGKASAQTINGVNLADLKEEYIEFHAFKQSFGGKMLIWLEYGQKVHDDRQAAIVKDERGKNMEFNSAVDFINKMKAYGYELLQAHTVSSREDNVTKYYILKRKN